MLRKKQADDQQSAISDESGRNLMIFIPLGLLLGFIGSCCLLKYCKRPQVSDIQLLRVGDDESGGHNDSIVDYSKMLSPKQPDPSSQQ